MHHHAAQERTDVTVCAGRSKQLQCPLTVEMPRQRARIASSNSKQAASDDDLHHHCGLKRPDVEVPAYRQLESYVSDRELTQTARKPKSS